MRRPAHIETGRPKGGLIGPIWAMYLVVDQSPLTRVLELAPSHSRSQGPGCPGPPWGLRKKENFKRWC
ncbi:rCG49868 [Rattus norvegicus]|uniref:RCG49868 n=1 Tax=Rattus norvegicus TaxID=10116 RepID=A6K4G9_RAT|nr:rCG49868 [Rattus norvegicus]